MKLPAACRGKSTLPDTVTRSGYTTPVRAVISSSITNALRNSEASDLNIFILQTSCKMKSNQQQINELDPNEWNNQPPQAVDQQVVFEQAGRADGPVLHTFQCEWDQENDDQRVENHRRQNRALRRCKPHDVKAIEHGI